MLSINNLHSELQKRESRKNNVYKQVLEKCHLRIISINKKSSDCYCFFVVPTVIFGVPLYNVTNCIIYIMQDLFNRGFKVNYTHPNLLFINWFEKPKKIEKFNDNNAFKLLDINDKSLIYHPTDFKTLEFKTENLFNN